MKEENDEAIPFSRWFNTYGARIQPGSLNHFRPDLSESSHSVDHPRCSGVDPRYCRKTHWRRTGENTWSTIHSRRQTGGRVYPGNRLCSEEQEGWLYPCLYEFCSHCFHPSVESRDRSLRP